MARALILGGGGPVGVAWEAGVIAGLADAGVDLGTADLVVGTSAGSIVGAHLAGTGDAANLVDHTRAASRGEDRPPPTVDVEALMAVGTLMANAIAEGDHTTMVKEAGRIASAASTIAEDDFVAMTGGRLDSDWPERDYRCTAWNVATGDFRVWDAEAGVPLERAVASSCSVPGVFPPVTIDGHRYMDGGIISATNAFLAEGHDRVVILSVLTGALADLAPHLRLPVQREVGDLRSAGSEVALVEMDEATMAIVGTNLMDFSIAAEVADSGRAQGAALADAVGALWG